MDELLKLQKTNPEEKVRCSEDWAGVWAEPSVFATYRHWYVFFLLFFTDFYCLWILQSATSANSNGRAGRTGTRLDKHRYLFISFPPILPLLTDILLGYM